MTGCPLNRTPLPALMGVEWRNRPQSGWRLVAGLLRDRQFRVPSAQTSRRRHDSPEIRHLRYYVRRCRIAALGRGVGTGPDVKREYDWVGRPPRGWWRRRLRRSTWRRWRRGRARGSSGGSSSSSGSSGDVGGMSSGWSSPSSTSSSAPATWSGYSPPRRSSDQATRSRGGESSTGSATPRGGSSTRSGGDASTRSGGTSGRTASSGSNDSSPTRRAVPVYSRPRDGRPVTGEVAERGTVPGGGGGGNYPSYPSPTRTILGASGALATASALGISITTRGSVVVTGTGILTAGAAAVTRSATVIATAVRCA